MGRSLQHDGKRSNPLNQSAIVIFTRGPRFHINDDKTDTTGDWVMNLERHFDKVVIYRRHPDTMTNDLYVAVPTGRTESPEYGRYIIELKDIRHVGTAENNRLEFAKAGRIPFATLVRKDSRIESPTRSKWSRSTMR